MNGYSTLFVIFFISIFIPIGIDALIVRKDIKYVNTHYSECGADVRGCAYNYHGQRKAVRGLDNKSQIQTKIEINYQCPCRKYHKIKQTFSGHNKIELEGKVRSYVQKRFRDN